MQAGLSALMYSKVLRLSQAACLIKGTGAVLNLQSNDSQKVMWCASLPLMACGVHRDAAFPPAHASAS